MSLQTEDFPTGPHDLRIVDARFLHQALPGYRAIDSAAGPGLWLLERVAAVQPEELWRTACPRQSGKDEFFELAQLPDTLLHGATTMVDLMVPVQLGDVTPDLSVVLEENDAQGGKLFYRAVAMGTIAPHWNLDTLRQVYALPAMSSAARAVVYVYNPRKQTVDLGQGQVRLSRLRP